MRLLMAAIIGTIAANAGFAAGLIGTIVVGPLTGRAYPAVTIGVTIGLIAMLSSILITLRSLGRLRCAVLLSH